MEDRRKTSIKLYEEWKRSMNITQWDEYMQKERRNLGKKEIMMEGMEKDICK